MTCMDSFLAWYWIFMSSVQSSMIWAASRYSIVSMHNCQRIDWISKKRIISAPFIARCKYHNNFYVLQFLQQEFQMEFFLRSLQTSTTSVWFKVAFFPISNKNSHWVRRPKRLPWVTFSDYISSCQGRRNQEGKGDDPPYFGISVYPEIS